MAIIKTYQLPAIEAKVERVNKRAAKLGIEGVRLVVSEPFEHDFYVDTGFSYKKVTEIAVEVSLDGATVKMDGWTFLAAIDHVEGLVKSAPYAPEDMNFSVYVDEPNCDHCKLDRRRNATFIAQHDDGRLVQVGRTCLKDFLGHNVPLYVVDQVWGVEDEFFGGIKDDGHRSLVEALAITNAVIRTFGWVPRSKAYNNDATADTVASTLYAREVPTVNGQPVFTVDDHDVEVAESAIAWAKNVEPTNDYLFNVRAVANNGFVSHKSMGIAASIISAHQRATEKELERKRERAESAPVPVTDERITVTGQIIKVGFKEGWGYNDPARKVITVRDDHGFKLWGTCPSAIDRAEQGDRVTFTARVERSDRDETFGFFSRPTKPAIVEAEEVSA